MCNVELLSNVGNQVQKALIRQDLYRTLHPPAPCSTLPGGDWFKVKGWGDLDQIGRTYLDDKPLCRTSIGFTHPKTMEGCCKVLRSSLTNPEGPLTRKFVELRTFNPYGDDVLMKENPTQPWCLCIECKGKSFGYGYRFCRGAANMKNNNSYEVLTTVNGYDKLENRLNLHSCPGIPSQKKLLSSDTRFAKSEGHQAAVDPRRAGVEKMVKFRPSMKIPHFKEPRLTPSSERSSAPSSGSSSLSSLSNRLRISKCPSSSGSRRNSDSRGATPMSNRLQFSNQGELRFTTLDGVFKREYGRSLDRSGS